MSLWNKLAGELLDIVECSDAPSDALVYRFVRYQNEIKYGAKLIVREGQGAVFVNEGKLADVFTPGTYTLETQNLPLLSTLRGWSYGFHSPFKAEVYFFSTRPVLNQQWGTQQPITMELAGYGLGEIRAYGQASYKISDPTVFFRQMVGTTGILLDEDLHEYLRGLIIAHFTEALTASHPSVEQLSSGLTALDATLQTAINTKLQPLGFELVQFFVENLSLPPALRDEVFEYSRLNKIDLGKLTQLQAAKSITMLAGNSGSGTGAQGMQLGVGLAAGQQVMKAFNTSFVETADGTAPSAPPPIESPTLIASGYHIAVDGKAEGPLSSEEIAERVVSGSLLASTLVWHPGMTAWAAAGSEPGLQHLFAQEPPPLT